MLWASVLYGIGANDDAIVTVALSQIRNVGGQPYWSWYGFDSRVAWCACFVSWCADECRYDWTVYSGLENVPRRYAISHRNRYMVDKADFVVA